MIPPMVAAPKTKRLSFDRFLIIQAYRYAARIYYPCQWSKAHTKLAQLSRIGFTPPLDERAWKEKGSPERQAAAALLWKRRHEFHPADLSPAELAWFRR
jgi:hypothetical protein